MAELGELVDGALPLRCGRDVQRSAGWERHARPIEQDFEAEARWKCSRHGLSLQGVDSDGRRARTRVGVPCLVALVARGAPATQAGLWVFRVARRSVDDYPFRRRLGAGAAVRFSGGPGAPSSSSKPVRPARRRGGIELQLRDLEASTNCT